jgi:hypothetical protein
MWRWCARSQGCPARWFPIPGCPGWLHRSPHGAAPLKPLPQPADLEQYRVRKHARADGTINEYRLAA